MDPVVLCQLALILLVLEYRFVLVGIFYLSCFQFGGLYLFNCCRESFSLATLLAVQVSYLVEVGSLDCLVHCLLGARIRRSIAQNRRRHQ